MAKRPNSRRNLDIAIERVAGRGPAFVQARTLMADAVVAQMLPDGAVKGGSALKLRFGDAGTRFSEDLDTARASGIDEYIGVLNAALEEGWQGFTGAAVRANRSSRSLRHAALRCKVKLPRKILGDGAA